MLATPLPESRHSLGKILRPGLGRLLPLLEPGRSLRFATLPPGQDPDDLVRTSGSAAFEAVLAAAEPMIYRLWRSETEGADIASFDIAMPIL